MNKQLFARFLTMLLLAWGATGVPVLAQDEPEEPSVTEEEPPVEISAPLSITIDGATIAELDNWDGVKAELKSLSDISYCTINVWCDIDESFGQWELSQETLGSQYPMITIDLHGNKIHGQGITASLGALRLYIKDDTYKQVGYQETAPYTVTNPNSGGITLTAVPDASGNLVGGSIEVLGGAEVELQSGCVESTNQVCFIATGDITGEGSRTSKVSVCGGYLKGKAGCVFVKGNGAQAVIQNPGWYWGADGTRLVPVLEGLDYAAVAGSSSNEEGKKYGGTSIYLDESVIIGRSETEGRNAVGVYHPQQGELNINEGATIVAYSDKSSANGVAMRGGTLRMQGGTIFLEGHGDAGTVGDIENVYISSGGILFEDASDCYDTENMKVYVSGGVVRGSAAFFRAINDLQPLLPNQTVSLSGGKYFYPFAVSDDNYYYNPGWNVALYAADGYGCRMEKDEATGCYYHTLVPDEQEEVVVSDGVAWHFADFGVAFKGFGADWDFERAPTIKLKSDISASSAEEAYTIKAPEQDKYSSYFVLDLNGHTLSGDGSSTFRIAREAHLKLLDSQGGGIVEGGEGLFYLSPYSELVVESGEYHGNYLVILGESHNNPYYYDEDLGKLTILDGKFQTSCITDNEDEKSLISRFDYSISGGLYTQYLPDFYEIDPTCVLEEIEDDVYWWRVASAVQAVYGTAKTDVRPSDGAYTLWLDAEEGVQADRMAQLLVRKDLESVDMKVKKNFPSAGTWCAFYAPFAVEATPQLLQDFDFAKIWDTEIIEDQTTIEFIQLNAGDKIPAFTPCLVRAKAAGLQTMAFPNVSLGNTNDARKPIDCSTVKQKFTFTGVFENTSVHEKYVLNGAGALVYATNAAAKLSPMKWYMEIEDKKSSTAPAAPQQVKIRVLDGETSGITDLGAPSLSADGKVYTLQGSFVGTSLRGLPAGIYVRDGRKVVVR